METLVLIDLLQTTFCVLCRFVSSVVDVMRSSTGSHGSSVISVLLVSWNVL